MSFWDNVKKFAKPYSDEDDYTDDYEDEENFTLEFVKISEAIKVNREHHHGDKQNDVFYQVMIERDSMVLEGLLEL